MLKLLLFTMMTYEGNIGLVVNHPARIQIYRQSRSTKFFRGTYDLTPGNPVGMQGEIKSGVFRVYGWFETRVTVTDTQIWGEGVQLWRVGSVE